MVQNLTESLKNTPWILWLMVAAVAMVSEAIELHGWLGAIAGGLVAGGIIAVIWPQGWWLQWLIAVAVTALLLLLRRLRHRRPGTPGSDAASASSAAERRA